MFVAAFVTAGLGLSEQAGTAVIYLSVVIIGWLYSALMESSAKQATLGKLALGIKVTNLQGERIGFGRATGRYFGMILSSLTLCIGFVMAGFTRRRQALHDMVAGTLVVKRGATAEQLTAHPEAPAVSMWTIVPLVLLAAVVPVTGILAAIAIPAYQDYTIRVQVTDGLMAASQYKAAVAEAVASNKTWDEINSDSLGLSPTPPSNYLQSIEVVGGVVVLTYGQQANGKIADAQLLLVPGVTQGGDVIWTCGFGKAPAGIDLALSEYEQYTSVEKKYLPSSCRG